jgi:hypothetical protein
VAISITVQATDQMSACRPWPVWVITSGAIQYGVPFTDLNPDSAARRGVQGCWWLWRLRQCGSRAGRAWVGSSKAASRSTEPRLRAAGIGVWRRWRQATLYLGTNFNSKQCSSRLPANGKQQAHQW